MQLKDISNVQLITQKHDLQLPTLSFWVDLAFMLNFDFSVVYFQTFDTGNHYPDASKMIIVTCVGMTYYSITRTDWLEMHTSINREVIEFPFNTDTMIISCMDMS